MYLDKQHPMPVYLQLKEMLQSQIEQGVYRSHQKLPSERDLCQHYNLSRMTARRALKELINEGLAYTRVGKGTFVNCKSNNLTKSPAGKIEQLPGLDLSGVTTTHYRQKLIEQLLSFNTVGVERVISEALATYSPETVAVKLFSEVIRQLEQQWRRGETSLLAQNYTITTLRSQLIAMVSATATSESGPKVMLACAPEDQHEIGLLLLALCLRRRGCLVIYLGPNISPANFYQAISTVQPQLICFSAATIEAGAVLSQQGRANLLTPASEDGRYRPETIFAFGGVVFAQNPALVSEVAGLYLGNSIETAVMKIQNFLSI